MDESHKSKDFIIRLSAGNMSENQWHIIMLAIRIITETASIITSSTLTKNSQPPPLQVPTTTLFFAERQSAVPSSSTGIMGTCDSIAWNEWTKQSHTRSFQIYDHGLDYMCVKSTGNGMRKFWIPRWKRLVWRTWVRPRCYASPRGRRGPSYDWKDEFCNGKTSWVRCLSSL